MESVKKILSESSECTTFRKKDPDFFKFWDEDIHAHYGRMNKIIELIQIDRNILLNIIN